MRFDEVRSYKYLPTTVTELKSFSFDDGFYDVYCLLCTFYA
jgi:hypothetical protein